MFRVLWSVIILYASCSQGISQNQIDNYVSSLTLQATDIHLSQVLRHLHDKYDIDFAYDQSILNNPIQADIDIRNEKLEAGLEEIFRVYGLEVVIKDPGKVLLRKREDTYNDHSTPIYKSLNGIIVDAKTKEAISFALISIPYSHIYTTPDEQGRFSISYPGDSKNGVFRVQLLGFESYETPLSELRNEDPITISLKEDPVLVDEIVVLGRPHIQKLVSALPTNSRLLTKDQLMRSSAYLIEKDLLRSLQFLPGVAGHNDEGGSVQIRGSGSDEAIILLDKIPLYSSSHFYGIFSAINPNYIESIELFKNNYPIQFGGKVGGMVKMNGLSSIPKEINGNIGVGLLHGALNLNIPLSNTGVISLSGRSTIRDISNSNFYNIGNDTRAEASPIVQNMNGPTGSNQTISSNPSFGFKDIHGRWSQRLSSHKFGLGFFYSKDDYSNDYTISFNGVDHQGRRRMNNLSFTNIEEWTNVGASFDWEWKLSTNTSLNTTAYTTNNEKMYDLKSTLLQQGTNTNPESFNITSFQNNKINDVSIDLHVDQKFSDNHRIIVGSKLIHHKIDFIADRDTERLLGKDDSGDHISLYAQWVSIWKEKFTARIGLRGNYFSGISNTNISPIVELGYLPHKNISLKTSYSNYDQYQRSFSYENSFGQTIEYWALSNNQDIPIMNCSNYMVGGVLKINSFYIDIEAYYRDFTGILELASSETGFTTNMGPPPPSKIKSFVGSGNTKGIDLGIGYENKHVNSLLSYTLSKSVNRFPEILNGHNFPSQNDRRHQLKSSNTFILNQWSLGINYVFASGRPYTDLSLLEGPRDRRQIRRDQRISFLPDYHRLDVGIDYALLLDENKISFGFSVINIFDRKNVKYIQNIYAIDNQDSGGQRVVLGTETNLLGRTLNFNINYSF